MTKKFQFINSFILKLIAIIAMTFDHIGVMTAYTVDDPLRIIGRIALPLFIFMAVEGAIKTKNPKKYILRIGITAAVVSIALIYMAYFMDYGKDIAYGCGNIFIDLLFVVLIIRILMSKNKKIKPLIALPIAYSILCYVVLKLEGCGCRGFIEWLPPAIRMQYTVYSIVLGIGFYVANLASKSFLKSYAIKNNMPEETYLDNGTVQLATNLISILVLSVVTVGFVLLNNSFGGAGQIYLGNVQYYAILSGAFILFYNGNRGYNAKWFKYACYAYYPLHILILAAIFLA